jgi:folate-dependent phosphoribosylglycinamide formyltransferase PurN
MRTYFLFHDHWYQYIKADWAASRFPFDGFIVIKKSRPWWGEYLWRRARRLGWKKVFDEVLLRVYWLLFRRRSDHAQLRTLMSEVQHDIPASYSRPPVYWVDDINSDEAVELLKNLRPDVCVLMVHPILKEKIFSLPPLGMLVFHPGLTPEYRGPHSAFWATLNNEFWGIGWSLLRLNKGIDTGKVLAQDSARTVDPLRESHVIMQHKAHVEGLPGVVETLRRLERGEAPEISTAGRRSTNYTHPGFTDYLKMRKTLRSLRREPVKPVTPKSYHSGS